MNKVILITGAAKRIGKEIAKEFFSAGAKVIIHFNNSEEDAVHFCEELNEIRPSSAVSLQANLDDINEVKALAHNAS